MSILYGFGPMARPSGGYPSIWQGNIQTCPYDREVLCQPT